MMRMDGRIKEFDATPPGSTVISLNDSKYRNAMLLHYLHVESLVHDPMRLIGLLHNRSSYELEHWAPFDTAQMQYGELVPYKQEDAHRWNTVGYPRGICVLEAQAILYSFLPRIIDVLVPEGTAARGNAAWKTLTISGFRALEQAEFWSPFANAPFSKPHVFNPVEHLSRLRAHSAAAEDHLRFLQTDPAYLQDSINDQIVRSPSIIMDGIKSFYKAYFVVAVDRNVAIAQLRTLVRELTHLTDLYHAHRDQNVPVSGPPNNYERGLSGLEQLCLRSYDFEGRGLGNKLCTQPGFKEHFRSMEMQEELKGDVRKFLKKVEGYQGRSEGYFCRDPLLYWLVQLASETDNAFAEHPPTIIGHIEEHLARYQHERSRVSSEVYEQISRMCSYFEIIWAIRLHRPCPRPFRLEFLTEDERIREFSPWKHMNNDVPPPMDVVAPAMKEAVFYLIKSVEALWPKGKHDHSWLSKATEARDRLDAFWAQARVIRKAIITNLPYYTNAELEEEMGFLSAALTEEHQAEVQAEKDEVAYFVAREAAKKAELAEKAKIPTQTVWCDARDARLSSFELPIGREKPKTRRDASDDTTTSTAQELADHAAAEDPPTKPPIPVNGDSLRIFDRMFPLASKNEAKGIVKWFQVVTAMADAGFSATHSGGSAVHFTDGNGSIVFQKPHPTPDVDPIMLQTMGKRMRKWFGWYRERFVERQKYMKFGLIEPKGGMVA